MNLMGAGVVTRLPLCFHGMTDPTRNAHELVQHAQAGLAREEAEKALGLVQRYHEGRGGYHAVRYAWRCGR